MSLYKLFYKFNLLALLIFSISAFSSRALAQENESSQSQDSSSKPYTHRTIAVSYISWTEMVDFTSATNNDRGYANFYGNAFSYEIAPYQKHSGMNYQADFLIGQANIGGSQTILTYQESYEKMMGLMLQARYAHRLDTKITLSAGPLLLARQVTSPDVNGIKATVGNAINLGFSGTMGARLGKNWELRQSFGTLAFKASAIWSVGLGYKY